MTRKFKPRIHKDITREALESHRMAGEGVRKIGRRYKAHPTTVRNWLIRYNLETKRQCIEPQVSIHPEASA